MTLPGRRPGIPELLITPVSAAVEPYRFETCTGDQRGPAAVGRRRRSGGAGGPAHLAGMRAP